MSSKAPDKKFDNNYFMLELELSDTIVSFKELLGCIKAEDIYSGKENIPFLQKQIEFQKIMLNEFIS